MASQSISKVISANPVRNGGIVTDVRMNGSFSNGPAVSTLRNFKIMEISDQNFDALNVRLNSRFDDPLYYSA